MIADREAEKARLESCGGAPAAKGRAAMAVLPSHGELRKQFRKKVADLRASLDNDVARPKAAEILSRLVAALSRHPDAARHTVFAAKWLM